MPTLALVLAIIAQVQTATADPTSWTTIISTIIAALLAGGGGVGGMIWRQRATSQSPSPPKPAVMDHEDSVRDALRENSELTAKNAEAIHDTATTMQALTAALETSTERTKEWQERTRAWQDRSDDKFEDIKERLMQLAADAKAQRDR